MGQFHSGLMAGRTVLITGGTGGIGRTTALGLAAMGARLAITGRDRGRAEDAAREIRAVSGGTVDGVHFMLRPDLDIRRSEVISSVSD
jgi:retinol dehydrogenase 14